MPTFEHKSICDVGLVRTNNEDSILDNESLGLWLVADGMGGHAAGEVASKIASETIESSIKQGKRIEEAVGTAHKAILSAASVGDGKYGMGSTVVALHSKGSRFTVAWVGDSRAYLWGDAESDTYQLHQLTTDHSYVQMLYQSGLIKEEELSTHPEKNIITQCLGSNELEEVQVDSLERPWRPNDWVLLCSDGLTDIVSDQVICDTLYSSKTIEDAVQALLKEALNAGGKDNVSIVIVSQKPTFSTKLKSKIMQVASINKKSGSE